MKSSQKTFETLNVLRILLCIAIFLYHLNILKGGYLAVCVFFVLSSYFAVKSSFNKGKFSILEYYKNRLIKIYLPLLAIVFLSIFSISFFKEIGWFNLKPETTSVLLGYNNFWQLSANLDYFARHVDSPFMHLWYISILMQFELVFPLIFAFFKKIGDKVHRSIPCLILVVLSIVGSVFFFESGKSANVMFTYYDTFTRSFSLLFGLTLGFIHSYYGSLVPKFMRGKKASINAFMFYLIVLLASFFSIGADSKYFIPGIFVISLIAVRMIDYASILSDTTRHSKLVAYLASITYEVYLVQYPIIFIFQFVSIDQYKNLYITLTTLIVAIILHFIFNFRNTNPKTRWLKYIAFILVFRVCLFGVNIYIDANDHTEEMKELEIQLALNEKKMQERQEEYAESLKTEQKEWNDILSNLEAGEKRLNDLVAEIPLVGIGDSVMLGALDDLNKQFSNGYFDAAISRTAWVVGDIMQELKEKNMLGEVIILNLGANGDCPDSYKRKIIEEADGRKIFWLNVTNDKDVHINDKLAALAKEYDNFYVIDWAKISQNHPEYFYADGIHLTEIGRREYTKAIYEAVLEVYKSEFEDKKNAILDEHEQEEKNRISFIGNDLLLNSFHLLKDEFKTSQFIMDKNYNYETIKRKIEEEKAKDNLNYRIVFTFDSEIELSIEEYEQLVKMCSGHEIFLLAVSKEVANMNIENVKIVDFYKEISTHEDYLMVDKIHLTTKGNEALATIIKEATK